MATDTPKKKLYTVKDPDAHFIAGVRISPDRTVELFPDAARYDLLAGNLEEARGGKAPVPASSTSS
jgi:hypothetical protein